jgi:hypothetical protein
MPSTRLRRAIMSLSTTSRGQRLVIGNGSWTAGPFWPKACGLPYLLQMSWPTTASLPASLTGSDAHAPSVAQITDIRLGPPREGHGGQLDGPRNKGQYRLICERQRGLQRTPTRGPERQRSKCAPKSDSGPHRPNMGSQSRRWLMNPCIRWFAAGVPRQGPPSQWLMRGSETRTGWLASSH